MNIIEYLTDIIDNNNPQNNPSADDIGLVTDPFNNIRFSGANPNNYIEFGNDGELWRIIGVFKDITTIDENRNEKTLSETLVKIVRDESLGLYSWDTSASSVNGGKGYNDWSQADLMYELNCDGSENSQYCRDNIVDGYLSNKPSETTETTGWFNDKGDKKTNNTKINSTYYYNKNIQNKYQTLIESIKWKIGAWNTNNIEIGIYEKDTNTSSGMYAKERSEVYSTKTLARPLTWIGKIGLIYPTDYAFASEDAACKRLNNTACANLNWLFKSSNYWTITHNKGNATNVWFVQSTNAAPSNKEPYYPYNVYPSLYLKADTKILRSEGDGTKDKPYKIYLENNE